MGTYIPLPPSPLPERQLVGFKSIERGHDISYRNNLLKLVSLLQSSDLGLIRFSTSVVKTTLVIRKDEWIN